MHQAGRYKQCAARMVRRIVVKGLGLWARKFQEIC